MNDEIGELLILQDDAGDYYLLGRRVLELARIPADRSGEIDQLLQATETFGFDEAPVAGTPVVLLRVVGTLRPSMREGR